MKTIKDLKQQISEWAVEIRQMKDQRKGARYGYVAGLDNLRQKTRSYHVAYCEMRGTPREKIEPKCRPDNPPCEYTIEQVKATYGGSHEEAVCDCA